MLIDVDMIVTRPLGELIERARSGGVVAFRNDRDRFVPEWGELLDLGPVRRQAYVSSGLVLLGGAAGAEALRLLDDRQGAVEFERTFYGSNDPDYPFRYPEQDVLNAVICARVAPERFVALDHRLAPNPPFRGLRLVDKGRLRCRYADGGSPYVLHHFHRKPWIDPIYHGLYSRLLARLLLGREIAIEVGEAAVPLRMRAGAARARRAGPRRCPRRLRPLRAGTAGPADRRGWRVTARTRTAAFYVVTGSDFFPGAVALLNSLRLQGHREPVFVLDCGMLSRGSGSSSTPTRP